MNSFSEILRLWPSQRQLAADLGVDPERVRKWVARDSIPSGWFLAIISAAHERGFEQVTIHLLATISSNKNSMLHPLPDENAELTQPRTSAE